MIQLMKRMICSRYFILSIICGVIAHILNLGALLPLIISGQYDIVFYYDYSIGFGSFSSLFVLAPAISCGLTFWEEAHQSYYRLCVTRMKKREYLVSRIVCVMLISAFSAIIVVGILFLGMRVFLPFIENESDRLIGLQQDFHGYLWAKGGVVDYIIFYMLLAGLNGMLWGVFSFTVSTFTEHPFVILASPVIASQALDILYTLTGAPNMIQPYHLMSGYFILGETMEQELLRIAIVFVAYLVPLIMVFTKRAWRMIYE